MNKCVTKSVETPFLTKAGFHGKYITTYYNDGTCVSKTFIEGRITRDVAGSHESGDELVKLYLDEACNNDNQ